MAQGFAAVAARPAIYKSFIFKRLRQVIDGSERKSLCLKYLRQECRYGTMDRMRRLGSISCPDNIGNLYQLIKWVVPPEISGSTYCNTVSENGDFYDKNC